MLPDARTRRASRRENEVQQRRQEILKAARELFVQKGFRNTTLDDIAEVSAFGKGTIYNYFPSKDDLFCDLVYDLADEMYDATQLAMEHAGHDTRARLLAYAESLIHQFREHDDITLMLIREHHHLNPELLDQFAHYFRERLVMLMDPLTADVHGGRIRSFDPQALALLFDGMIRTYCLAAPWKMWPGETQTPSEVAGLLVSVFFDGIANPSYSG